MAKNLAVVAAILVIGVSAGASASHKRSRSSARTRKQRVLPLACEPMQSESDCLPLHVRMNNLVTELWRTLVSRAQSHR